jgi:aryl-alcohol dehydrogenase-like predicted oxidoreductase
LLDTLTTIARLHDVQPVAVALAWLLHQPMIIAPLASVTSTAQLTELLVAPTLSLDDDEISRISAAADFAA